MSRWERNGGWRDQAYSAWHRTLHDDLDFLDIDWIEYCHTCNRRLAVYELCADLTQTDKVAAVTKGVAEKLGIPGYVVLYEVSDGLVARLRVRRMTSPATDWKDLTPDAWACHLLRLRTCHPLVAPAAVPIYQSWCREPHPEEAEVCTKPTGHVGPHEGPGNVWPRRAVAS